MDPNRTRDSIELKFVVANSEKNRVAQICNQDGGANAVDEVIIDEDFRTNIILKKRKMAFFWPNGKEGTRAFFMDLKWEILAAAKNSNCEQALAIKCKLAMIDF